MRGGRCLLLRRRGHAAGESRACCSRDRRLLPVDLLTRRALHHMSSVTRTRGRRTLDELAPAGRRPRQSGHPFARRRDGKALFEAGGPTPRSTSRARARASAAVPAARADLVPGGAARRPRPPARRGVARNSARIGADARRSTTSPSRSSSPSACRWPLDNALLLADGPRGARAARDRARLRAGRDRLLGHRPALRARQRGARGGQPASRRRARRQDAERGAAGLADTLEPLYRAVLEPRAGRSCTRSRPPGTPARTARIATGSRATSPS